MKAVYICILLSLIFYVNNQQSCQSKTSGVSSANDCKGLSTPYPYCCYIKTTVTKQDVTQEDNRCIPVSESAYKNVEENIRKTVEQCQKSNPGATCEVSVDCKSSFLTLSSLGMLLLLL